MNSILVFIKNLFKLFSLVWQTGEQKPVDPVENFAATPLIGRALLTTVNSSRDGSGAIETVLTAGTYGCHINRIRIKAMGSTTAGMVRLHIHTLGILLHL